MKKISICPRLILDKRLLLHYCLRQRQYKPFDTHKLNEVKTMTAYEKQILDTSSYYDTQISLREQDDIEILRSVVADSRVNQIIHNPVDEGIDEG